MTCEIVPAMDIIDNQVVRLINGDYRKKLVFHHEPLVLAKEFWALGFRRLHVIDLEGAKTGHFSLHSLIKALSAYGFDIQVGGGFRSLETILSILEVNPEIRIILSSKIIEDSTFSQEIFRAVSPQRIIVSCDTDGEFLFTHGWKVQTNIRLLDGISQLMASGVVRFILTDIRKDGTLSGISRSLYTSVLQAFPTISLYAAGGISSYEHVESVKQIGLQGCVIGRAIYESREFRGQLSNSLSSFQSDSMGESAELDPMYGAMPRNEGIFDARVYESRGIGTNPGHGPSDFL